MPWFEDLYSPASRAREFQQNSRVQGMSESFDKLGLRIDVAAGGLEIRTGRTEALMRMLGLGSRGAILELDPGGPAGPRARAFVKLRRPEDGPIQLPTVMTATSRYPYPWLDIHLPIGLATSRAERLAIADWLPIHDSWVGDLLDTLLATKAS
jgi:hypothetical protein